MAQRAQVDRQSKSLVSGPSQSPGRSSLSGKVAVYSIKPNRDDDGLETLIEQLRKERLADERRKRDELTKESIQRKRIQEARAGAKGSALQQSSYDINGNVINVQRLKVFPNLVPTCGKVVITGSVPDDSKAFPSARVLKPTKGADPPSVLTDSPATKPSLSAQAGECRGLYEALVPATGVTFSEAGKNPKCGGGTVGKQMGRMSKTELQTMQEESYMFMRHTRTIVPGGASKPQEAFAPALQVAAAARTIFSPARSFAEKSAAPTVKARPARMEITGDMSQLLVRAENFTTTCAAMSPKSVLPVSYGSPQVRRSLQAEKQRSINDLFNMSELNDQVSQAQRSAFRPAMKAPAHLQSIGTHCGGKGRKRASKAAARTVQQSCQAQASAPSDWRKHWSWNYSGLAILLRQKRVSLHCSSNDKIAKPRATMSSHTARTG